MAAKKLSVAEISIRKIQEAARQRVESISRIKSTLQKRTSLDLVKEVSQGLNNAQIAKKLAASLRGQILANVLESNKEAFGALSKELTALADNNNNVFEVLPQHCKFYASSPYGGVMILEYEPQRRTIHSGEFYNIPFPYLYFVVGYNKDARYNLNIKGVGVRNAPLKTSKDVIDVLPMPHVQGVTGICQPAGIRFDSLTAMVDDVVGKFYGSEFVYGFENFFLIDKSRSVKKRITSFEEWSQLSTKDILMGSFKKGMSVQDILKYGLRYCTDTTNLNINRAIMFAGRTINSILTKELSNQNLEKLIGTALQKANPE